MRASKLNTLSESDLEFRLLAKLNRKGGFKLTNKRKVSPLCKQYQREQPSTFKTFFYLF